MDGLAGGRRKCRRHRVGQCERRCDRDGRGHAARRLRRVEAFWRRARGRGHLALGAPRRPDVDHRPERRRQDLAAQHHQRLLPARHRLDPVRGQGRDRHPAFRHRRARHRPHLSEHRAVRRHDRARQHHARPPCADARRDLVVLCLLGVGAARGGGAPRPGRGADRASRTRRSAQAADQRPRLRLAKAGRTRPRPGARPEAPAAR